MIPTKDSEKRIKENQTGKAVVNKNKQKAFILGDSIFKHIQGWEITKNSTTNRKFTRDNFLAPKLVA